VTAPVLLTIFDSVYVIALTAWVGSILFFSFAVAPISFRVLGAEAGGTFVRALFPRYYLWGVISSAVALPALVCGPLAFPELQALAIIASLLIMLYCGNSLTPAINEARDAGAASAERFDRLHKRSVNLNGVVLLIGLVLLFAFASRKAPTTDGIVEKSPRQMSIDPH
jgi:uncharacterized membrane protein